MSETVGGDAKVEKEARNGSVKEKDLKEEVSEEEQITLLQSSSPPKDRTRKVIRPQKLEVYVDERKNKGNNEYVIENVRKKKDRAKLEAYDCHCCTGYYKALNLTDEEQQERMKKCSRHRGTTGRLAASSTPPGFWNVEMPTTPEAIEQGMMTVSNDSSDIFQHLGAKKEFVFRKAKKRSSDETSNGSQISPLTSSPGQCSPISSRKAKRASLEDDAVKE